MLNTRIADVLMTQEYPGREHRKRSPIFAILNTKWGNMDFLSDEYKSDANRQGPLLAVLKSVRDFVRSLIGFFTFTNEDKLKAGINVNGKKHDG